MSSDVGAHRAQPPHDERLGETGADEPGAEEPDADGNGSDGNGADGNGADGTAGDEVGTDEPRDAQPGGGPGTTRIAAKVVERLAQRSVDGLDRAFGSSRHLLGVKVGSLNEDTPARVNATVDGDLATVRVAMAVRWPDSVRQVTRQARDRIRADISRFTGLRVAHVDITVSELLGGDPGPEGGSR